MGDEAAVVAALKALFDAGLVTDRHALNVAWAELTGRPLPRRKDTK